MTEQSQQKTVKKPYVEPELQKREQIVEVTEGEQEQEIGFS